MWRRPNGVWKIQSIQLGSNQKQNFGGSKMNTYFTYARKPVKNAVGGVLAYDNVCQYFKDGVMVREKFIARLTTADSNSRTACIADAKFEWDGETI
jgi:hypothetical protein